MSARESTARPPAPALRRFFGAMVRPCFASLGIGPGELADYVTDLLARFSRTDQLYRVRDSRGRPLSTLTDLLVELMEEWGSDRAWSFDREVDLRRHCGDYALFLSGIFRAHVEAGGHLSYYLKEGGESYRLVGERLQLVGARQARLFRGMADRFEELSGTLDYLRKVHMVPALRGHPYGAALRGFEVDGAGRP